MKRFLITVDTNWVGMDNTYKATAENESDLHDVAELAAYENFQSFGCDGYVMEELFPEFEGEYTDEMWDKYNEVEGEYYGYYIREFEGSDEEFNEYEKI